MQKYYQLNKILNMNDLNGEKPEIYIIYGNRASGKTTAVGRYFIKRYINYGEKFVLLYRFNYELDDVANKFFKDIGSLFFPDYIMTYEKMNRGAFCKLLLGKENEEPSECGYAIALNNADQVKKYSHYFSDVTRILFDEFQSETNHYCPNEIMKFQSIHASIARGHGEQSKYVPVFLLGNDTSIINPYFSALGISQRLTNETKFMRGNGFVLQHDYNENAANALKESSFNKAFSNSYSSYLIGEKTLNDSTAFIEKAPENGRYLVTIVYQGQKYSIKEYPDQGFLYVSDSVDNTYPIIITVDIDDHKPNYLLISKHDAAIQEYKNFFNHGCVRFKNQLCKNAFISLVTYDKI